MCPPPGPTQYIFHMPMARYSLYVLTASLNTKQTNKLLSLSSVRFSDHFPGGPWLAGTKMFPFWILVALRTVEDGGGDN